MIVVGIESGRLGSDNQTRAIILEGARKSNIPVTKSQLLRSIDGKLLHRNQYANNEEFHKAVHQTLTMYYQSLQQTNAPFPDYFALPFDHGNNNEECEAVDLLAKYINEFAKNQGLNVKTIALTAKVHNYQNIDLIHVGRHLITYDDEIIINSNHNLKSKLIITDGVPSNLNWINIEMQANSPKKSAELTKYKDKKVALFVLGGKTSNGAINFTIEDAQNLLTSAKKLKNAGYEIIFTNSQRTPNEVTDFLYENCNDIGFGFYNSKQITDTPQEAIDNFTIYHGKYNQEFKQQSQNIDGNIYPAVLSLCRNNGFVVNTWDSFSYTSEAAALGITSVVYKGNSIDTLSRPDCKKLLENCEQAGYIKILDESFINLADKDKKTKIMPVVNQVIYGEMKKRLISPENTNQQQNPMLLKHYQEKLVNL